ncbi:MAG: hypothetical protein PHU44_00865 [Syntrophales bacterium]|nr:hypothetical protein [Syntrophales bacterium]MDD5643110.1 hypothetical protein [Syntrophales bacterium]
MGREIALCRKMIKKLENSLEKREVQYGMTTAGLLQSLEEGSLSAQHPIQSWKQEYQELQYWQKRLIEYEEALGSVKRL